MATAVFFLLGILTIGYAVGAPYIDCGSSGAIVSSVSLTNCENQSVCPLKRGTKVDLAIVFESRSTASTLKAVVHGIIGGVPIPFNIPEPDACTKSGLSCPLQINHTYNYTHSFDILTSYPPLKVDVKWELQDDKEGDVVCIKIPVQLT